MGKTSIEWTNESSNPIKARNVETGARGWACIKIASQCDGCYAESMNMRLGTGLPYSKRSLAGITWEYDEKALLRLQNMTQGMVFVQDMSDLFLPQVPVEMVDRVFDVLETNTRITPQILTKWPARMAEYLNTRWERGRNTPGHIWVGCTYTKPADLNHLAQTPASVRFVSCEPLIELADDDKAAFEKHVAAGHIHQIIAGGESGKSANHVRPMHPAWARFFRDLCQAHQVAFFLKQWGCWKPVAEGVEDALRYALSVGKPNGNFQAIGAGNILNPQWCMFEWMNKKEAGNELDGQQWKEFPRKEYARYEQREMVFDKG